MAAEAIADVADTGTDQSRGQPGQGQIDPEGDAKADCQQGGKIAPDAVEGGQADNELAVDPNDEVEARRAGYRRR